MVKPDAGTDFLLLRDGRIYFAGAAPAFLRTGDPGLVDAVRVPPIDQEVLQ